MLHDIVIAVLTYRRPGPLDTLLPALTTQAKASDTQASVLVIDNDPDGSAADTVGRYAADGVRYVNETRPGIAAARNRALDEAGGARLLIFIDDDEIPHPGWLDAMVGTFRSAGEPTAVVGPVVSEFDRAPDAWVAAGDFFRRRRLPTGSAVTVAATNNLLLDLAVIDAWGLRFDEKFGISGGSDTLFTRTIHARGGRMVWCDEAIVTDQVPADRVTRRWVLLRALRSGNSWSRVSLYLTDSTVGRVKVRATLAARGSIRALGGAGRFLAGFLTRSTSNRAKGLRTVARGVGMVGGAFGYTYMEYRRRTATHA